MASSPTPSIESLPGANSNSSSGGSFGEPTDYLSDSPLTLSGSGSGSSPPASDSAICDDYIVIRDTTSNISDSNQQQQPQQQFSSILSQNILGSLTGLSNCETSLFPPRCTGCKNKKSDAVAKCIDCVNYLCLNCVTAHQFMHCFNGHNVFRISNNNCNSITDLSNDNKLLAQATTVATLSLSHNNKMNVFETHRSGANTNSLNGQQQKEDTSNIIKSMMNSIISPSLTSTSALTSNSMKATCADSSAASPIISSMSQLALSNAEALLSSANSGLTKSNRYFCTKHTNELMKIYCRTCQMTICKDCMVLEHSGAMHECERNSDQTPMMIENLLMIINELRAKANEMKQIVKNTEHNTAHIQIQYHKAQNEINETYQFYRSMLDERKQELLKELDSFYNSKTMSQSVLMTKSQDQIDKVLNSCEWVEKFSKSVGPNEINMLKRVMENKLQQFISNINDLQSIYELDFVSNYQAIQVGVRNTFGYIRSNNDTPPTKQPPIARPTSTTLTNGSSPPSSNGSLNGANGLHNTNNLLNGCHNALTSSSLIERPFSNGGSSSNSGMTSSSSPNQLHSAFDTSNILSKRFSSINSLGPFIGNDLILSSNQHQQNQQSHQMQSQQQNHHQQQNNLSNPYEKWSNGCITDNLFGNIDQYSVPLSANANANLTTAANNLMNLNNLNGLTNSAANSDSMLDLTSKLMSTTIFPPKSQIKRQKMIYHCKFGEFGVMEGQFTEPSGVAVNAQNDIIVADTNNHRIQIFDKEGRFKFQFGECGKRDSQLLYPNRVAVVRTSGDIIVTERSPTHQIQIYNQYGQFVRKFGANILQHPRGVTVDNKGRIVVVECKVMRVIIFDQNGNVLQKFGCSKHLEFPNGVVVNDKQEIFISDNRAHCVKVFNYEGVFLRQIGGEGITNYPIGVGINANGEILIADNHNNFNLTIFTQDGQLVSALESKVKHAQCFDVALMDDGSVVLASKDYRLYIYRYIQVPPIGL